MKIQFTTLEIIHQIKVFVKHKKMEMIPGIYHVFKKTKHNLALTTCHLFPQKDLTLIICP